MPDDRTVARVVSVFVGRLNIRPPEDDVDLLESGLVDSLTFIDLISELEREFGLPLDEGDLDIDDFRSVTRIAALLERVGGTP